MECQKAGRPCMQLTWVLELLLLLGQLLVQLLGQLRLEPLERQGICHMWSGRSCRLA